MMESMVSKEVSRVFAGKQIPGIFTYGRQGGNAWVGYIPASTKRYCNVGHVLQSCYGKMSIVSHLIKRFKNFA